MAYYPRKRAKRETPSFRTFPTADEHGSGARAAEGKAAETEGAACMNFLAYKAGMLHVGGKSTHSGSTIYGQRVVMPATVLECPPMKVFGIRAYEETPYGARAVAEVWAEKLDKNLKRRIKTLGMKGKKKRDAEKDGKKGKGEEKKGEEKFAKKGGNVKEKKEGEWRGGAETAGKTGIVDLEKIKARISEIKLMAHSQPALTGIGKKKPAVVELKIAGCVDAQLAYAKEKLGKEISVGDIFSSGQFVDVKAVDKGKGFAGVIKRFGVKMHRPKAKKRRCVGSIGPWTPATVMYTVARPGQHGYQTRTEYNKRILEMGDVGEAVTPDGGFENYGVVKNPYVLVAGSVPGPAKRAIALRYAIRSAAKHKAALAGVEFISTKPEEAREVSMPEPSKGVQADEKTSVKGKVKGK